MNKLFNDDSGTETSWKVNEGSRKETQIMVGAGRACHQNTKKSQVANSGV